MSSGYDDYYDDWYADWYATKCFAELARLMMRARCARLMRRAW